VELLLSDSYRVKLRKYSKNVVINGLGVIMFGAWSVIKIMLMCIYTPAYKAILFRNDENGLREINYPILLGITILAVLIAGVHFYLGTRAIDYGRGRSEKKTYLFVVAILLFLTVTSSIGSIIYISQDIADIADITDIMDIKYIDDTIVSTFTDAIFISILIDLFYSTIKVANIRKSGSL
jgi:hypothetical protein